MGDCACAVVTMHSRAHANVAIALRPIMAVPPRWLRREQRVFDSPARSLAGRLQQSAIEAKGHVVTAP
jgi:hypothetical protein